MCSPHFPFRRDVLFNLEPPAKRFNGGSLPKNRFLNITGKHKELS